MTGGKWNRKLTTSSSQGCAWKVGGRSGGAGRGSKSVLLMRTHLHSPVPFQTDMRDRNKSYGWTRASYHMTHVGETLNIFWTLERKERWSTMRQWERCWILYTSLACVNYSRHINTSCFGYRTDDVFGWDWTPRDTDMDNRLWTGSWIATSSKVS